MTVEEGVTRLYILGVPRVLAGKLTQIIATAAETRIKGTAFGGLVPKLLLRQERVSLRPLRAISDACFLRNSEFLFWSAV